MSEQSQSEKAPTLMSRRFVMQRDVDVSGVSGTGIVAHGVLFVDGTVVIRWIVGTHHSTVLWTSMADVEAIHGHDGRTVIQWIDADDGFTPSTMFDRNSNAQDLTRELPTCPYCNITYDTPACPRCSGVSTVNPIGTGIRSTSAPRWFR